MEASLDDLEYTNLGVDLSAGDSIYEYNLLDRKRATAKKKVLECSPSFFLRLQ